MHFPKQKSFETKYGEDNDDQEQKNGEKNQSDHRS